MSGLTLNQINAINVVRCAKWHTGRPWSLAEWTNALSGEAGEAGNVAKKILRVDTGMVGQFDISRSALIDKLGDELADTILYALLIFGQIGIDPEQRVRDVFNAKSDQLGFPERL
jgi:NTP pyrophosphatase (non-canonical NTP hydrolase)